MNTNNTYDVVVVGSGIVGLGAAYAAVRRGLRVAVVDRTDTAVGASIRNFGHLCIGAQTGEARRYGDISRGIWLQLARDADFWLRESGTLLVARRHDELAVLEAAGRDSDEIRMLDAADMLQLAPLRRVGLLGGAHIATDLQTNPRTAGATIAKHLARLGVDFHWRTAVKAVRSGVVKTTRGTLTAGQIVLAVNHDLDQLVPQLAEDRGIIRCALDMMRVAVTLPKPLSAPVLTGWSMVRYGRFAALPETAALRTRLHTERPDLAAIDLNQMYTQLPDGTLIIGDSHASAVQPDPFQHEIAFDAFLAGARQVFDMPEPRVLERWQGVYAKGSSDFLIEQVDRGVLALAATTGIGMTTGLGLAEDTLTSAFGWENATEGTA